MNPDQARRRHYLEAMGIDIWLSKAANPGPGLSDAVDATIVNAAHSAPAENSSETGNIAQVWQSLADEVSRCRLCSLCETRTQTVFGSGNKRADWMLIGEAPGQQEDIQGQPFVGRAGALLTEMLRAIGLSSDDVYIANTLKCRPPGNRDPKPEETAQCRQYLNRQIALIKPKIILAVGRISAQTLLATDAPVARLRGKIHTLNDTPLVVVYHPAYLLRNPIDKRKAWQDLQFALSTYNQIND